MANNHGNGLGVYGRLMIGAVITIVVGLLIAGITGLLARERAFTLMEEKFETMGKVDALQTKFIEASMVTIREQERLILLLTERQTLLIKAFESQREELREIEQRVRRLEGRAPSGSP